MMLKNKEVQEFSFENNNENKLKLRLNEIVKEYNVNKAYSFLAIHNQLMLISCNIDENEFYHILFKNYIYFLNSNQTLNLEKLPKEYQNKINDFNYYIENANIEEAFNIFSSTNVIYQLLCSLYIKNLNKSEDEKLNEIPNEKLNNAFSQLSLLENATLNIKREKIKVYQKISSK